MDFTAATDAGGDYVKTRRIPSPHLVVCVLVLAACETAPRQSAPLPAGPQVVEVEMSEYSFAHNGTIESGRALFRVTNRGRLPHNLSLVPLAEDIPPIDEQLRGGQRRAATPFAGIAALAPNATTTFAADLASGVRYAFICFLEDPDGTSHALRGMSSEFRASGTARPGAPVMSTSPSSTR